MRTSPMPTYCLYFPRSPPNPPPTHPSLWITLGLIHPSPPIINRWTNIAKCFRRFCSLVVPRTLYSMTASWWLRNGPCLVGKPYWRSIQVLHIAFWTSMPPRAKVPRKRIASSFWWIVQHEGWSEFTLHWSSSVRSSSQDFQIQFLFIEKTKASIQWGRLDWYFRCSWFSR